MIWPKNMEVKSSQQIQGRFIKALIYAVERCVVTKEERAQIPHHLLDVCNIEKPYSAADYQKAAYAVIDQIIQRGHIPFLSAGLDFIFHL